MSDDPRAERSVLLLGSSRLNYVEGDPSGSLTALLSAALGERAVSVTWRVEGRPLFYGPRMPEVARRHWETTRADFVVVDLGSNAFADDVPIARIRRRWPRLYPFARRMAERFKVMAGGGQVASPRGWLFRFPRWLVLRLVGAEPEVEMEAATAATLATLDQLLRLEDPVVICSFGFMPEPSGPRARAVYRSRVQPFTRRVLEYCREHHVAVYDRLEALAEAGRPAGRSVDRNYVDRATREFDAAKLAEMVAPRPG